MTISHREMRMEGTLDGRNKERTNYWKVGWKESRIEGRYVTDLCRPVSDLASRRALRSSARGEILVPRTRSALKQRRAFSVTGPSNWNQLPLTLRLLPQNNVSSFCKLLETFLLGRSWTESASE